MISTDKYPDVTLEEAEALVDLLGWNDAMQAWAEGIHQPLEFMGKNRYIFGLMDALYGELHNGLFENSTLTLEQWRAALDFYNRVEACEREDAIL